MKVFLSFASADRKWAEKLRAHLTAAGLDVWNPEESILPGEKWAEKLGQALDEAVAMIVLVSPEAAESEYVQREIEYAIGAQQYARKLIPVVVRPTSKLPWILRHLPSVQLNNAPKEASEKIVELLRQASDAAPSKSRAQVG